MQAFACPLIEKQLSVSQTGPGFLVVWNQACLANKRAAIGLFWQQIQLVEGSEFRPKTRRLEGGASSPLFLFMGK